MKTIEQLIERHGLKMETVRASSNPNMPDAYPGMQHSIVTLKAANGASMTLYFSQGAALKPFPTLAAVLDCLASDAAGVENADSFEDWAQEYGYDEDSRASERVYNTIGKQGAKLALLLGEDGYSALLWDIERE